MSVQIAVKVSVLSGDETLVLFESPPPPVEDLPQKALELPVRGIDRVLPAGSSMIAPGMSIAVAV